MSTRREMLKQLVGVVVAPAVVPEWKPPAPGTRYLVGIDDGVGDLSKHLMAWFAKQKADAIQAARDKGHKGPWTWEHHFGGSRVLKDGKGVVCG